MKDIYKLFHRGNLPHIFPEDTPIFITYNLTLNSPDKLKQLLNNKKKIYYTNNKLTYDQVYKFEFLLFDLYDQYLSKKVSPCWLMQPDLADIVFDSLIFGNTKFYKLHCFCIMPNHVHVLLTLKKKDNVSHFLLYIMQNHKRFTARKCNQILDRTGQFWHREYFDHYCRSDEEYNSIVWYILNNPVKAKLIENWQEWKYTWIDKSLKDNIEF